MVYTTLNSGGTKGWSSSAFEFALIFTLASLTQCFNKGSGEFLYQVNVNGPPNCLLSRLSKLHVLIGQADKLSSCPDKYTYLVKSNLSEYCSVSTKL